MREAEQFCDAAGIDQILGVDPGHAVSLRVLTFSVEYE